GIDGHSTVAHVKSFDFWLDDIPDLQPKYILYYIGINDSYISINQSDAFDHIEKPLIKVIRDNSALWNLVKRVKGTLLAKKSNAWHDHVVFEEQEYDTIQNFSQIEYKNILGERLDRYKERLQRLIKLTEAMGARPIFVTQPMVSYRFGQDGTVFGIRKRSEYGTIKINGLDHYYFLKEMNKSIDQVAGSQYLVIDLTDLNIWETDDFYDFIHMNPKGTKKLATVLARKLIESKVLQNSAHEN
ncbi:MAG: hypothetical protein AAFO69_14420, partial [Bacteroidota bacterium]